MGQRLGLIIGNSAYLDTGLSRLLTPDVDVGALGEILLDAELGGFDDVNVLVNMSSHIIRRAIASFFSKKSREDLLLLYFSGHGVLDDQGHLYLAVRDTDSKLLRGTAISAGYITDEMNNSRSQRQVLILDCCHSGAFARGTKGQPGASVGTASAFEGTGYGRVVLTASDATQYAWEGEQVIGEAENSLFTHYVLQGIKSGEADLNGDGQITIDELYDYVYERVVRQTPKQTPGKWSYKERGEIILSRAPGKTPEEKVSVSLPEFERDLEEKLHKLYNEGLSAYWLEDWDKAVRCFQAILEARPDYPEAGNKLELSRRKQQMHSLYEKALAAEGAGDWVGAIARLNELLAIEPEYQDAAARLEQAKRSRLLGDLYAEARQLSQAEKWQAVVNVFAQIASLAPDYPDPEGLLGAAQAKVAEHERLADLEHKYSQALREMDAGRWSRAEALLAEVQEMEPGYQAAERLLERAKLEVARQQEARQLEEQVSTLYQQAQGLMRAKHWHKALEKMEEIRALSPDFEDAEGVTAKARAEIEREEGEAQRQKQLAEKYAAAVRSLEAGQYQLALEQWNEVQNLDPKYPDRQRVLKNARKKLKELSKVEAPRSRPSRQRIAMYALGGVVLLAVVVYLGIRGYGGGSMSGTNTTMPAVAVATNKPTQESMMASNLAEESPCIVASVGGDFVWTNNFSPEGTLTLSIYESQDGSLLWRGSKVTNESGFVHFESWDHGVDLLPEYYLVVSDGWSQKAIFLETITIDIVDIFNDFMVGTAPAGRNVQVSAGIENELTTLWVQADPESGEWMADFKSISFDITEEMWDWSFAQIYDEDGDANEAGAPPKPDPWIRAHPVWDSVDAWFWPQNVVLHLTIDDPGTPAAPDLEMDMDGEVDPQLGSVWFEFAGVYDLKAGDEVIVTDGTTTRHLVVSVLTIEAVDVETDTVQGRAEPDKQVDVQTEGGKLSVLADANGNWSADFRRIGVDLLPGMEVLAAVDDEDGDPTNFIW